MHRLNVAFCVLAFAGPAAAQPSGGWRGPGWGGVPPSAYPGPFSPGRDPREGKIEVERFVANTPAAAALGHGAIVAAQSPGSTAIGAEEDSFNGAVTEQLIKAGYSIPTGASPTGQIAELTITHEIVQPAEPPHSPVSGEVAVGAGSRGVGTGLALDVDLSKPLKALVATKLEARILDRSTNAILWQGRATIVTREGDRHWTGNVVATRLAAALFKGFPSAR